MNKVLDAHEKRAQEYSVKRDQRDIIGRLKKAEKELAAVRTLKSHSGTFNIHPRLGKNQSEATAVACLSDVHVGNHITLAQTNGINEYNVGLARSRCATFFERVVRLTCKERQDLKIEELVLFLGGDNFDGNLHMDTALSNIPAAPMTQAVIAQEIIESGLKFLLEKGNFKRITIVCKDGNHGRISVKQHWNSRVGNSLEWYMYYNLRERYPMFKWVIDESFFTYLKVYDWMVRFHHGDTVFFGGQNGFYQNGGFDGAAGQAQFFLCHEEDVVPQTGF